MQVKLWGPWATCAVLSGLLIAAGAGLAVADEPSARPAGPAQVGAAGKGGSVDALGIQLFSRLAEARPEENLVFSPASLGSALLLLQAGAAGSTDTLLQQVGGLPSAAEAPEFMKQLIAGPFRPVPQAAKPAGRDEVRETAEIALANAAWLSKQLEARPEYVEKLGGPMGARLELLDFTRSQAAAEAINAWTRDKTRGLIDKIVSPDMFDSLTRLVLTNAIYFNASWQSTFAAESTADRPFTLANGEEANVPTMRTQTSLRFVRETETQPRLALLPYRDKAGRNLGMVLVQPGEKQKLAEIESGLSPAVMQRWVGSLMAAEAKPVSLQMPKYDIATQIPLREMMEAAGLKDLFQADRCDLSGISTAEQLHVSAVLQKARIRVHENGTEAAAVTAVMVRATSAMMDPPEELHFDRPHLFAVVSMSGSGSAPLVLFVGRLADPRAN